MFSNMYGCCKSGHFLLFLRPFVLHQFARAYFFVCLSVCLCAGNLKKSCTDLDESFAQVGIRARNGRLHFGGDPEHRLEFVLGQ